MNVEQLFIKATTPLSPTKEKKGSPLPKHLTHFGRGEPFLSCLPQNIRFEFNIQVPTPGVDGVQHPLKDRSSDW